MTKKEIQSRNEKAEQLRVLLSDDGQFFVESGEGKILYKVDLDDTGNTCTCGDFSRNSKADPNFNCKHILGVMNAIPKKEVDNAKFLERPIPRLDDRFLINIKGKDFVLYAGVLDLATQKGLLKLEVELLQFPSKENGNEAICRSIAESKTGEVFSDIGDANPANCHAMIAKHFIRMASTRAKARALRDMCNIGIAAVEELADFDDVIGNGAAPKAAAKKASPKTSSKPANGKPETPKKEPAKAEPAKVDQKKVAVKEEAQSAKPEGGPGPVHEPEKSSKTETPVSDEKDTVAVKMSEAQKRAIYNLSRRRGISVEELEKMATETYGIDLESLSSKDASVFIRNLQQAA